MDCTSLMFDEDIISSLKEIWNFTKLNQTIEPCDVIFACGCSNLDIPVRCAELFKQGYGKKILFAGGVGKITKGKFQKSEAEVYRDIAIRHGVPSEQILLETRSTNTGDNFRFSKTILEEYKIESILVVHFPTSERRTLATAQAILPEYRLFITSPELTFSAFLSKLQQSSEYFYREVSLLVGDIQRMIIYLQLGWQKEVDIPDIIIQKYYFLKEKGFRQFIYSPSDILKLINDNHISVSNVNLFS